MKVATDSARSGSGYASHSYPNYGFDCKSVFCLARILGIDSEEDECSDDEECTPLGMGNSE